MLALLVPADREVVHHFGELEGFGLAAVQDGGGDVGREFGQADNFASFKARSSARSELIVKSVAINMFFIGLPPSFCTKS